MQNNSLVFITNDGLPTQYFNGKAFKLYKGERYFSRGCTRMHVEVWKHFNGLIPKKYHVHHKNENTWDNSIDNLEIKPGREHIADHGKKRFKENPDLSKRFQQAGMKRAKGWHKSDEGRLWHSQHAKQSTAHVHENTIDVICDCCGEDYKTSSIKVSRQRFCSNACKSKWRRQNGLDDVKVSCKYCTTPFNTSKYHPTKYCSRQCASKGRRYFSA